MSEYIIEIPDEYFASYDTERDMYYPDERDSAMPITPFVRCRDCKYYKPWVLSRPENGGDCVLNKVEVDVWFDGFCAWGERRES